MAILDDDELLLESLGSILGQTPGFLVPRLFTDPAKALRSLSRRLPSIALVDLGLPGDSGLRFIRNLRRRQIECPILVLTGTDNLEEIIGAISAGADGYLLKSPNLPELVSSIRRAAQGEIVLSASILRRLLTEYRQLSVTTHCPPQLTEREKLVLELTWQGKSCQEIARQMKAGVHAVYSLNKVLYRKLKVTSRAGAAARWRELRRTVADGEATDNAPGKATGE